MIWKKSFLSKEFIFNLFFINFTIIFFISILNFLLSIQEIGYGTFELSFLFYSMTLTTIYYQKYNNKIIIKRMKFQNKSKTTFQLNLFLIVFIFAIFFINFWIMWIYIFEHILHFRSWNIGKTHFDPIIWKNVYFNIYYYFAIMTAILLITFTYLINHFIKDVKYIYAIIFALSIYLLFFGNVFVMNVRFAEEDHIYYFNWISKPSLTLIIRKFFLFPWLNFGIFGRILFLNEMQRNMVVNWFDYHCLSNYFNSWFLNLIKILPFIFIFIYTSIPIFHNFYRKK